MEGTGWGKIDSIVRKITQNSQKSIISRIAVGWLILSLVLTLVVVLYPTQDARATLQSVDGVYSTKKDTVPLFSTSTAPTFLLDAKNLVTGQVRRSAAGEFIAQRGSIVITLVDNSQKQIAAEALVEQRADRHSQYTITFADIHRFTPGRYTMFVTVSQDDRSQTISQDFRWGVLALNFDQSSYKVNETVEIGVGVLDDQGHTLCDAILTVTIIDPHGKKTTLGTENGQVKVADSCADKNVTNLPDYFAAYQPTVEGQHQVELEAQTTNGVRATRATLLVTNTADLIISRKGTAMRIYPAANYLVRITILAHRSVDGGVEEKLPAAFQVANISHRGVISRQAATQTIHWPLKLKKGESVELSYLYDPPDISPEFYLLGPLKVYQRALAVEGNEAGQIKPLTILTEPRPWEIAADAVNSVGRLFYGDTANNGLIKFQTRSDADSWTTETSSTITPFATPIQYVVAARAPTRDEMMILTYHDDTVNNDGDLAVTKCLNGCDASADFTSDTSDNFTFNGAGPISTCDTTTGACHRPADLAYEQLSGEALVVFADDPNSGSSGSGVKYCTFDGTAWSGSNCSTPSNLTVSSSTGVMRWIRLIPQGGNQITRNRSDRILVLMADSNNDLFGMIWNGSEFVDQKVIDTDLSGVNTLAFDGEWETVPTGSNTTNNRAIVFFAGTSTSSTTAYEYIKYVAGTGWDSAPTTFPASVESNVGRWIDAQADPKSDRICIATVGSGNAFDPWIWRARADASDAITRGNSDASIESNIAPSIGCAWEKTNGGETNASVALFVTSDASTVDVSRFQTWTSATGSTGTFTALARIGSTNAAQANDDTNAFFDWGVAGAPNGDTIMVVQETITADLESIYWNGTGWALADYLIDPAGTTAGSDDIPPDCTANCEAFGYFYIWNAYKAWQKDWRWSNGNTETNSVPATFLAAENTTPTVSDTTGDLFRLRVQVEELGDQMNETDARKKLQFVPSTTCSNPDNCAYSSWIDVGDPGSGTAWEYASDSDITCSPTDCDDGVALTGTALTGTTACGSGGCGTWVGDRDAAPSTSMDHNANVNQEIEYIIKNVSAVSTTYYFRIFDVTDGTVIYRQQDSGTACEGSAACSYPSLTLVTPTITVSGNAYADEGTTAWDPCDGTTANISLVVNGGAAATTTCADSNGAYSFSSVVVEANWPVSVFFNTAGGNIDKGVAVTVADSATANITLNPRKNILWVKTEGTVPSITNTNLDHCDSVSPSGCANVPYHVTTGALTVADGAELHIEAGKTFSPGGSITTSPSADATTRDGDVHIAAGDSPGVLSMDTNALSVGGDFINEGTFSAAAAQTTTFTATATGHTITDGGENFVRVVFNGSGGGWSFTDSTVIDESLTMTAGTLSGTNDITVTTNAVGTAGVISLTGGTFEQRVGANQNFGPTTANTDWTFHNLTFSRSAGTPTVTKQSCSTCDITVTGILLVSKTGDGAGTTLNAGNASWTLSNTNAAKPFNIDQASGDLVPSTSTFIFSGDNDAGDVTVENEVYWNLTLGGGGVSENYDGESAVAVHGDLTVASNGTLVGSDNWTTYGEVTGSGTITLTGGTFNHRGDRNLGFGSSGGSNDWTFYNLTVSNSSGSSSRTSTIRAGGSGKIIVTNTLTVGRTIDTHRTTLNNNPNDRTIDVDGSVVITDKGTLEASDSALFTVGDDWTLNSGGVFTHNNGTVTFDTTALADITGGTTFYNFTSTTAGKTLQFDTTGSPTFNFAGTFTITGGAGPNEIQIRSDTTGTKWRAKFDTYQTAVTNAKIQDSGCDSGTADVAVGSGNVDQGNNESCWFRTLTFSLDATSKDFGTITPGAAPTDQTSILTTTTNAKNGYQITLWATQLLTKGSDTIANWSGTNATPTTFTGAGDSRFGYRTNDSNLGGGTADRFTSAANLFAGFVFSGAGDPVADNTGPVTNEEFTITYRLRSAATQAPGTYTTTVIFINTANY